MAFVDITQWIRAHDCDSGQYPSFSTNSTGFRVGWKSWSTKPTENGWFPIEHVKNPTNPTQLVPVEYDLRLAFNQAALRADNFTSMHCTPSFPSFNKSVSQPSDCPKILKLCGHLKAPLPWCFALIENLYVRKSACFFMSIVNCYLNQFWKQSLTVTHAHARTHAHTRDGKVIKGLKSSTKLEYCRLGNRRALSQAWLRYKQNSTLHLSP